MSLMISNLTDDWPLMPYTEYFGLQADAMAAADVRWIYTLHLAAIPETCVVV